MTTDLKTTVEPDYCAVAQTAEGEVEYVQVVAKITDRWGGVEDDVYAGQVPAWSWPDPAWKKATRDVLLAERTTDPAGWTVRMTTRAWQ